jgi:hypothetical protein
MELDKAIKIFEEGMHKNICKHQEFAFCHDEDGAFYHAMLAEEHAQMAEWLRELKRLRAGKWIPVSERLPEEETDVFICNANGDIAISRGSYSTEVKDYFIWYTSGWRFGKVIAWMPLPEPYKAESEGRNDT